MDYLRSCYKTSARFWADTLDEVDIVWYFAADDTFIYGEEHSFGSLNYGRTGFNAAGEVPNRIRPWRDGSNLGPVPPFLPCGTDTDFREGAYTDDPRGSYVFCCGYFPLGLVTLSGDTQVSVETVIALSGLLTLSGDSVVSVETSLAIGGLLALSGDSVVSVEASLAIGGLLTLSGATSAGGEVEILGLTGLLTLSGSTEVEEDWMLTGDIFFSGRTTHSEGLLCNGQAVSRSTYANLFAVIGTTFGAGNGTTTFNVPNLDGRFPVGTDTAVPPGPYALGATGGVDSVTLTTAEMPTHNHGPSGALANLVSITTSGGSLALGTGTQQWAAIATTANTGSGGPHENRPPYLALHAYIKI